MRVLEHRPDSPAEELIEPSPVVDRLACHTGVGDVHQLRGGLLVDQDLGHRTPGRGLDGADELPLGTGHAALDAALPGSGWPRGAMTELICRNPGLGEFRLLFRVLADIGKQGQWVILVDTIGKLSYLYRYGVMAYIGGGFGKGIHNILEAATYGLPVIFGPKHQKFSEALELLERRGAFAVGGASAMLSTIHQQLENPKLLKTTSAIAGNYVLERVGATSAIMESVCIKSNPNML